MDATLVGAGAQFRPFALRLCHLRQPLPATFCPNHGSTLAQVGAPFCCEVYQSLVVIGEVNRNACLSLGWSKKHNKRCREGAICQGGSAVSIGYGSCFAGLWSVHAPSSASASGSERTGGDASRAAAGRAARASTHAGAATARSFGQQDCS